MLVSSNDILLKIKQSIFNLAEQYEVFSKDSTKSHEEIKDFDKELGDLIERLKQLEDVNFTISDIELTDTVKESNQKIEEITTLILSITQKLNNNDFRGDAFKYEDFTPEQIEALKIKGDSFVFEDFTQAQKDSLKVKGDKGNPFIYSDFTPVQIEALKVKGDKGPDGDYLAQDYNNLLNKPINTNRKNLDFFRFSNSSSINGNSLVHLKTNILSEHFMLTFKFFGYAHTGALVIDSTFGVQYYFTTVHATAINNLGFPLVVTSYISDDGFIVLVLKNLHYISYTISLFSLSTHYHKNVSSAEVTEALFNDDSTIKMF